MCICAKLNKLDHEQIPFIPFKPNWLVKVIPPFHDATVRFLVALKDTPQQQISVYLDCFNRLGFMEGPYWEIYPYVDEDAWRCGILEVDALVEAIDEALKKTINTRIKIS